MKNIWKIAAKLFKKKSTLGEAYLAIFLMQNGGVVHVLQRHGTGLQSTHSERFSFTNGWDHIVEDVDDVLYRLETGLGDVPDKAIFFVFSHLVDMSTREIRKTYLHKIKDLVKSLDLEALGYIEAREAAVDFIQQKKRMPPSMILIEIDSGIATLFIYHNGQVSYHKQIEGHNGISHAVVETLSAAKPHTALPQDIVVYSYNDTDSETLGSLDIEFDKELFTEKPRIQIISEHSLENGLIALFSGQIAGAQAPAVVHPDEDPLPKSGSMGFVIGDDVPEREEADGQFPEDEEVIGRQPNRARAGFAGALGSRVSGIFSKFRTFRMPAFAFSHTILAAAGIVLILISLGAIEFFFHKATVTVIMPAQKLEKELELNDKDLTVHQATSSAQYTEKKKATGTKTVGEKAKGGVTIYNSSLSSGKSFGAGVSLTGPGGLTFVLDGPVSVASAEGDASSIKASTKDASITASAIGPEYNISAGSKFAIDGEPESEVIAKNGSALSGGSKETITIVSSADVEALKKLITEKVKKEQAKPDETSENKVAIPQLSSIKLDDANTTPGLSEEAETVQLKATGLIQSYYFDGTELKKVLADKLKPSVTENLVIKPSDITHSVRAATRSKSATKVTVDVTARATPTVDLSKIAPALVMKNTSGAERTLKDQFKARSAAIQVIHPIGILNGWMPVRKENISVEITFEDL